MKILACPICGNPVEHHCWHEHTEEVSSVLMDVEEAKKLLRMRRSDVSIELLELDRKLWQMDNEPHKLPGFQP